MKQTIIENLERNRSRETAFIELCSFCIDILAFYISRQIMPRVGILLRFFNPGAGVLHRKAVPGAGILTKKKVAWQSVRGRGGGW